MVSAGSDETTYTYTYDDRGNITSVSDGTSTTTYTYDSLDQLIREDNQAAGKTWAYAYDNGGNITAKTEYAYTTGDFGTATSIKSYTYGDSAWKDLLTTYNGQAITTDALGNLTNDGTRSYTWEHGRQLASVTQGSTTWSYTYDANGMRTQKRSGNTVYTYAYNGSQLVQMSAEGYDLYFSYDVAGRPASVYFGGSDYYYYVTNLQGDVIALLNRSGEEVVIYSYDAWGNILSVGGSMADVLGDLNPLRYRGYVYDSETGFYYVSSRYYDPEIGRWINADGVMSDVGGDIRGYNLFTYCMNNPVNMSDTSGHWPQWIKDAANWVNDNIIQPVVSFVKDIAEDINNYDLNNDCEEKVLESNYFSSYKGVPVIRTNGDRSGSFGAIFLTRETNNRRNPEDVLRHEYGHTKQLEQLGVVNYALCIGLPSWQQWGTGEYYSKPWEITADIYGGVQSRNHSQSNIDRGFAYLEGSKIIGPLIWVFIE